MREAAQRCGVSYRHGWGLLEQAQARFGQPVVHLSRGRGSRLTPLGELLLRHYRQVEGRLHPQLQELEHRLEAELEGLLAGSDREGIRIVASHDMGLLALRDLLSGEVAGIRLELSFRGSLESLLAWRRGEAELAGFHLPIGGLGRGLIPDYRSLLDPQTDCLLSLARREQGLMVMPGNPLAIGGLADLSRPGLRFINRQPGSGSRLLLDRLLREAGLSGGRICGYDNVEFTHLAVAAHVAGGGADAG
ncbi:MAG: MolR family transcriptional regulator, partial [Gammaproteobacteria bacterium]